MVPTKKVVFKRSDVEQINCETFDARKKEAEERNSNDNDEERSNDTESAAQLAAWQRGGALTILTYLPLRISSFLIFGLIFFTSSR
jgi:hypothetical protein